MKSPVAKSALVLLFFVLVAGQAMAQLTTTVTRAAEYVTDHTAIVFTVEFSEDVVGFDDPADILLSGTADGIALAATDPIVQNSASSYTVTVTVTAGIPGTVTVSIPAGVALQADDPLIENEANDGSDDNTSTYTILPTVETTQVEIEDIGEDAAPLGGEVTDDGGSPVTERGVVYDDAPGVTMAATVNTNGSGTGTFSESISGLDPETQYYYRAYAKNEAFATLGAALGSELSFWTLSTQPASLPGSVTVTAQGPNSMLIEFEDFDPDDWTGFAVIRKQGSAPTTSEVFNGHEPTDPDAFDAGITLVEVVNTPGQDEVIDVGLTPNTQYYYAVVPYKMKTTPSPVPQTTRYRKMGGLKTGNATTFGANSIITLQAAASSTLNYILYPHNNITQESDGDNNIEAGEGLRLAHFRLRDQVGDGDLAATELEKVTINFGPNWNMLKKVAIYDGVDVLGVVHDAALEVEFDVPNNKILASDESFDDFYVLATFKDVGIVDQTVITVSVVAAVTAPGSGFAANPFSGATTGPTNNKIDVIATTFDASVVTPSTSLSPEQAFGFTLTGKDANGFVDTNMTNSVTLSADPNPTTPPGFSSGDPGGLSRTPSSGVVSWSQLKITDAGTYDIKAQHTTVPIQTVAQVTIVSNGVDVTGPTVEVCYNDASSDPATFTTFGPITISESDKADFGVGSNQTYSIILPAGFIFDVSHAGVTVTTSVTASNDISGAAFDTYLGNNILRIKYSIGGTANKNTITINNMKVKYTSTTPTPTPLPILRVGGSASQLGNDETDLQAHGTLRAKNGQTVTFEVDSEPSGSVEPDAEQFSHSTSPPIVLIGKDGSNNVLDGVFVGTGVVKDSDNKYKFYPQNMATGDYDITFIYTAADGCKSIATKTIKIFETIIPGLNTQYCIYDAPVTIGPVTPPAGLAFGEFVYYDYSIFNWVALPGTNNEFNPSSPEFAYSLAYNGNYLYIGYTVTLSGLPWGVWDYLPVRIHPRPTLAIGGIPAGGICSDGAVFDIITTPALQNNGFDDVWLTNNTSPFANTVGITGDVDDGFKFDPNVAIDGSTTNKVVRINFKYRDETSQCTNEIFTTLRVNAKPTPVPAGSISIAGNLGDTSGEFCLESPVTAFSATPVVDMVHRWYDDVSGTRFEGNSFNPNSFVDNTVVGITDFSVTRTNNIYPYLTPLLTVAQFPGCESDPLPLTVEMVAPETVTFGSNATICAQGVVSLSDLGAQISGGLPGQWFSLSSVPGTFGPNNTFVPGSGTYNPSDDEDAAGTVTLELRTIPPVGAACGPVSGFATITINAPAKITIPQPVVEVCAGQEVSFSAVVTGVSQFTWSANGTGQIVPGTANLATSFYQPSALELNTGAQVVMTVETEDPDGLGPCESIDADVTVNIRQRAIIDAGVGFTVCSDQPVNLNGDLPDPISSASSVTWSGGLGTFSDVNDPDAEYFPHATELATQTQVSLTLTSDDPPGVCPAESETIQITINPKPSPPTPVTPREYCIGDNVELLRATGFNLKWYTDAGLTNQISAGPALATGVVADDDKQVPFYVTQTLFETGTFAGCESDATTMTIIVNPLPIPSFTASNFCLGDDMSFANLTTLEDEDVTRTITGYEWSFDDDRTLELGIGNVPDEMHGGITAGTYREPTHQYERTGVYNVRLRVVTSDNCTATYTSPPITVGPVPTANFSFTRICEEDATNFIYTGTESASLTSWTWDFGDAASGTANESILPGPQHQFTGVGTYDVTLTVRTGLGCEDDTVKRVSILPYVKTFPYIQNFEGNHGWVSEGLNTNLFDSWAQRTSAGEIVPKDPAQPNFWVTSDLATGTYENNERSVLNGPCVNMQLLERPVLSFDYWRSTELGADGAYIEYSTDPDGQVWTVLGTNNEGLGWYNGTSIQGLASLNGVGQNVGQIGWTGKSTGWETGKYNLDGLSTQTRVRFRFVFGSNASSPLDGSTLSGFALDYFKLETRNRLVLVENFTNANAPLAANNDTQFRNFPPGSGAGEVVKIEYHTPFPAADPFYSQNPVDPSARSTYYGVTAAPKVYIDGTSHGSFVGDWALDTYKRQSLVTSPIEITINNPTSNDGTLEISGTVVPIETALEANRYSLYIGVVEEGVTGSNYVLRKMLPSAAGQKVPATAVGQPFNFSASWVIDPDNVVDPARLSVVAFVQADVADPETNYRPILQAAINSTMPVINFNTGIDLPIVQQVTIYPNPADQELNILLPSPARTRVDIRVLDQVGKPVLTTKVNAGDSSVTLNTRELAGSMYIVQFEEEGRIGYRKVLITH